MTHQSPSLLPEDSGNSKCSGCCKATFSDIGSDDDPEDLLDKFYDKSRSAKRKVVSERPCYHGRVLTPLVNFNVSVLPLSQELLEKVQHIPEEIPFSEKCTPDDFYSTVGCSKDSIETKTNIIVFKFEPEDIEDEQHIARIYEHLVKNIHFARAQLDCEQFSEVYCLPLPKENEPPAFLPITSRLNLERCPREDNLLLGVLVKRPLLEEGELSPNSSIQISGKLSTESPSPKDIHSPIVSPDHADVPPSHYSPNKNSSFISTKSGKDLDQLSPADRYGSYIGEDLPFLTDPVDKPQTSPVKKPTKPSISVRPTKSSKLTEDISSESETDFESESKKPAMASRKRTASRSKPASSIIDLDHSSTSLTRTYTPPEKSRSSRSQISPPKKQKMSTSDPMDLESSESDPDADLFPRQVNKLMTGIFSTSTGDFEFKYSVVRSDRPEVGKYLPTTLTMKGRARRDECESCLTTAIHKPNFKVIIFQLAARDTPEHQLHFSNFVTYLVGRDRYGLCAYKPDTYRAYVVPYLRNKPLMKAFELLKFKPLKRHEHELYGFVIKKSAMVHPNLEVYSKPSSTTSGSSSIGPTSTVPAGPSSTQSLPQSQASSSKIDKNSPGSPDFQNLKAKFGPEHFSVLDLSKLAHMIHSSVDDLLGLSASVARLLQETTKDTSDPKQKKAANLECQSKVTFIMDLEAQQHAKRKKAYETILKWLRTLN